MSRIRVLICGAGVGGNALAFWLARSSKFEVTIIERFPELRTSGLQVDLRGHGITVMRRMGIDAAVRAKCVPELGLQLVDATGRRWGYLPANKSGKGAQVFTSEYEIMRGDLCQILYDRAKANVQYKFGTSMTSYTAGEGGAVTVDFDDGTSGTYDLVVGADGLHSRTRRMMLGSEAPDALHSLHQYIAYLRVPSKGDDYTATAYAATAGRFILTRRNEPDHLQVYLSSKSLTKRLESIGPGDVAAQKEAFAAEFQGAGWKSDELVDLLRDSDDFYSQYLGFVKLNPWSKGRVTLLGDAGYSASVNGYGTSCALIGAYILAGELERHAKVGEKVDGIELALEGYERQLRPHVDMLQRGLEEKEQSGPGSGMKAWQISALQRAVWMATSLKVYKLAGLFSDRGMKGWQLPDYSELRMEDSKV